MHEWYMFKTLSVTSRNMIVHISVTCILQNTHSIHFHLHNIKFSYINMFLVTCLQSLMHYRRRCNGCWGGNNFILFSEFQHGAVHFILHGVTIPLHSARSNWWTTQYEFSTSSKQPSKWPYSVCVLSCILIVSVYFTSCLCCGAKKDPQFTSEPSPASTALYTEIWALCIHLTAAGVTICL